MKKLGLLGLLTIVAGYAIADWIPQIVKYSTYTGSYAITNLNSTAVMRLTGVECKFNASSSGTFYIDLIRGESTPVTNRLVAHAFTTATALFFTADEFIGADIRPNDKILFSDSIGAALTNTIYVSTEALR